MLSEEKIRGKSEPRTIGRREKNKIEKRNRIISAARYLFNKQGFSETTTQQIADKAGIAAGTLFLYAPTKEDLLSLVFRTEMLETANQSFGKLRRSDPPIDQIMRVFKRMVLYHEKDIEVSRTIHRQLYVPSDEARDREFIELSTAIFSGFAEIVQQGQKDGAIRLDIEPLVAGKTIFAIYYMELTRWFAGGSQKKELLNNTRLQILNLFGVRG